MVDSKTQSSIISTAARYETSTSTQILSVANSYVNVKTAKQKIAFPLMAGEIISCLPSAPTSRPSKEPLVLGYPHQHDMASIRPFPHCSGQRIAA